MKFVTISGEWFLFSLNFGSQTVCSVQQRVLSNVRSIERCEVCSAKHMQHKDFFEIVSLEVFPEIFEQSII